MIYSRLKTNHVQPKTPLFTSDSQHPPRSGHAVYLYGAYREYSLKVHLRHLAVNFYHNILLLYSLAKHVF